MDVTKLFEGDKVEALSEYKLNIMIEQALAQPQIRVAANENNTRYKRVLAIVATVILALTVSLQFMPDTIPKTAPDISSDAYDEISDLIILETLNDLS